MFSGADRQDKVLIRHVQYVADNLLPDLFAWVLEDKDLDRKKFFRFVWRFMLVLKAYLKKKRRWTIHELKALMDETYKVFEGGG